mmetsp:Transcript_9868/g.13966  ORF Transcript_9868/g.13966 Transcript_9868/m.13966 type:complete len:94 (+) Transcript_9868:91-372(+)
MSGKPAARPSASGRPAGAATRRRAAGGGATAGGGGRGAAGGASNILQFYSDDSAGLQVGPTTVLVASLSFVGCVVLLHIWGKLMSAKSGSGSD